MDFDNDDQKLELQLRQFRPQPPRPLPGRLRLVWDRRRMPLGAAAAAVILATAASVIFFPRVYGPRIVSTVPAPHPVPAQAVTYQELRRFADDPAQLDAHLGSLSSQVLPDVRRGGGILSKLAQETW